VTVFRSVVAAGRFLTRVPLPGPATTADELPGAVAWFPLVGAACGAATAGAIALLSRILGLDAAIALGLVFAALLTGAFHEDGLADSADGLGGGATRERALEIMKDSRVGTYGAAALVLLYLSRFTLLRELGVPQLLLALPIAGALGRASGAVLMAWLPAARSAGMAVDASGRLGARTAAFAVVLALGVAALLGGLSSAALAIAALGVAVLLGLWLRRRLGGVTGDTLGLVCMAVEIAVLAVAVALGRAGRPLSPVWR
jgi:adenosylcobinamide-GDP ribazoletransferase